MTMSSRSVGCSGGGWHPGAVVAEQCPEDVDASEDQGDEGLDVFESLATFLEVEVAVGSLADDAGLRGEVEDPAQPAAVALGPMQVPGPAAGVTWDGDEPCGCESSGICVGLQIACGDNELSTQDRSDAQYRGDHLGLRMGSEAGLDLGLEPSQPIIECQDLGSQVRDDRTRDVLAGQDGCAARFGRPARHP